MQNYDYLCANINYKHTLTMKRHFSFSIEWYEIIRDCSPIIKGEVFTAVMEYATTGQEITVSPEATVIFKFIKREIDRREKRRKAAEARRLNKTGQKRSNAVAQQKPVAAEVLQPQIHEIHADPSPHTPENTQQQSGSPLNARVNLPAHEKTYRRKDIAPEKKAAIGQLMTVLSKLASDRE